MAFCGTFSGVVLTHEAGHYLAARRCGLPVAEFCLGFPGTPVVLQLGRYRETSITVRLLPFGGFVRFGDESAGVGGADGADCFDTLSPGQKGVVLAAGSLFNLVAGACLMVAAIMAVRGLGLLDSLLLVWSLLGDIVVEIARIVIQGDVGAISGPVGTAAVSGKLMAKGFWPMVGFTGLMSVSIGLMNLLPVPGCDGWHLLLAGVEAVRGKPLGRRFQAVAGAVGFVGITVLMVMVTYHDVLRILQSGR